MAVILCLLGMIAGIVVGVLFLGLVGGFVIGYLVLKKGKSCFSIILIENFKYLLSNLFF